MCHGDVWMGPFGRFGHRIIFTKKGKGWGLVLGLLDLNFWVTT